MRRMVRTLLGNHGLLFIFLVVIENNEIVYRDYVDISVAVATPKVCIASGKGILFYLALCLT